MSVELYPKLQEFIKQRETEVSTISDERKNDLSIVADFIKHQKEEGKPVNLNFLCTHNSRRSHLSQIWAGTSAIYHLGSDCGIATFSGGTEGTAFNPRAVAAIERAGFVVDKVPRSDGNDGDLDEKNPIYRVRYGPGESSYMDCFSKVYDHETNPKDEFAAVMTCSHADENCPFIPGAKQRIKVMYEDPKVADDTDGEAAKYDERCAQIAKEMLYGMSLLK